MELTEIMQELFDSFPEKIIVDMSEFETENHDTYKFLYENLLDEKKRLEEEYYSLVFKYQGLEKESAELAASVKDLKSKNAVLSSSVLPTMDSIKDFCSERIFVSDVVADPEHPFEETFDIVAFGKTISENPGVYGTYRPSWFTPLHDELSKSNIQKKNINETSKSIVKNLLFWKKNVKACQKDPNGVAARYDNERKKNILELINSDCSNEEKYLKYFLMTPGLNREFLKTLQGASELNINAKLLISLLEQPCNKFNKQVIESYVSNLHKGVEYNLKQELAEELIRGEWYIKAKINGVEDKFQLVPISVLENLINKINSVCEFLDSSADETLSAKLAESVSNGDEYEFTDADAFSDYEDGTPSFVDFDDSAL